VVADGADRRVDFFYGYIQPYYVVVLLLLTLSDYAIGLLAGRFRARWHGVLVSFVVNFGTLAYFKYANFDLDTTNATLDFLGLHIKMPRINTMLPIGISFHIFQSFTYVINVLDKRIAPYRSFVRYALYIS
jgi:D-alanyl-lipoteichoic acid acyltransferase DltB (MBOAT superfamily)